KKPWMFQEPRAKGKYIAFCEGDDFWTDPTKLEKQVEVLEREPEVVITGHDAQIINADSAIINNSKIGGKQQHGTREQLQKAELLISTLSVCYRNISCNIAERVYVTNGDIFLFSVLGHFGSFWFHHDIEPGVYRTHSGGVWSPLSDRQRANHHKDTYFWLSAYYKR